MRFLRFLGSGIGITLILGLILSLSLWFVGGYLGFGSHHPFDSVVGRLVGLAVLWIIVLLVILIIVLRGTKKDEALTNDMVTMADNTVVEDEVVTAELGEMRDKLKKALTGLRKSKTGRRHLYQLPWYIIIGPPGAGKTTAIVNSGLQFPLSDEGEIAAIGGVGGTRNCDWWFTDNAVLVDTAGRYTTQDSDADADNAAWLGFLTLLKKHRKRQPINGAIIAISLSDLSMQDETTQKAHAQAIRRRLHELREKLGVHFPVYILFTKADLIAGFSEYFDGLRKEEREQVWGFTLALAKKGSRTPTVDAFDTEFNLLVGQLNAQSLERIQTETNPQRRSMIASFPSQVASVQNVARDFLSALFQDNKYEHRQMLRGVYFTSGTQEGTPIDRLMMGMSRTFGIGRQAIGSGRGTGRSFFLTQLFDNVIFRESGLVSADDKVERRYRWTKRASFAAVFLVAIGMGSIWARSYSGNLAMLNETQAGIAGYRDQAALIPPSPVGDTDLISIIPALNRLRDLPSNPSTQPVARSASLGFGLYQGRVLGNEERLTYRSALNTHFLPRLLLRLENQMQASINDPDLLYETLKVYLTLGRVGPLNPDLVVKWMQEDWAAAFPDASREGLRADLTQHLKVLMSAPLQPIALNNDLVEAVQKVLTQMPQAQRVYNGIINSPIAIALPEWRLTDIGGPSVAKAFSRSSGKQLNDGIPGIYTKAGFQDVFLEEALTVAARIQSENWVLGEAGAQEQSEAALITMSRDVLGLYSDDFILQYDQLLGDIDIIPMDDLPNAVEVTNVLSGSTSPILNVLEAVAQETRLTDAGADDGAVAIDAAAPIGTSLVRRGLSAKSRLFLEAMMKVQAAQTGKPAALPGAPIESHFGWLHRLTAQQEGQPSELSGLIGILKDVYQELSNLNFAGGVGNPQDSSTALPRFQAAAGRVEVGPMKRWASQITVGSKGIATEGTRAGINAGWQQSVLPLCQRVTTNTYPFEKRANADASLPEFAELFRPNGQIDAFFKTNLEKFVDMSQIPWTFKPGPGAELGVSPAVLTQFENAALIRAAFFTGAPTPSLSFQLTAEALDPKADGIVLDIDGQTVGFVHTQGPPGTVAMQWPGSVGAARVTFLPETSSSENMIVRNGPWSLFRMLDVAELRNTNAPDRKRVIFNLGGRIAIFQMQSGSTINPFTLAALSNFSCPTSF
jgi:type VI secretion system protein ImpL